MAPRNFTQLFETLLLPVPVSELNLSFYDDVAEMNGLFGVAPEDENATQLIIANGTKTWAPKFRGPPRNLPSTFRTVNLLRFYTSPLIFVVGMLSNILAYLVFTRTRLRKVPSVPYLAAMAVVDSGALITDLINVGLVDHGIHLISWIGVCQYVTYFNYVFIFLCIWYPVALCVEKFICVYFPLRKASLCTPFRAKVVVISMAVMTGTCYYYVIYMVGPIRLGNVPTLFCREWDDFRTDFHELMKFDSMFVNVLPTIALVVLMILICGRGCEYYRISTVEVSNRAGPQRNASIRSPVRVTNVIFPVAFVMLTLKLPINFIRFYGLVQQQLPSKAIMEVQPVLLYVARLDMVIKLYIYLIFSPSFRRRTKSYLCSIRAKLKGRCYHDSSDEEEGEGIAIGPRINLPETGDRVGNTRACLMASDV